MPTISDTIQDDMERPIEGCRVTVHNSTEDGEIVDLQYTDRYGHFETRDLEHGRYWLEIMTRGRKRYTFVRRLNKPFDPGEHHVLGARRQKRDR